MSLFDRVVDALGDRTYPFGLHVEAGDGALTERLAPRCGRLWAVAAGPAAHDRLARFDNVVLQSDGELPDWSFDLVVCTAVDDTLLSRLRRASTLIVLSRDAATRDALRRRPGLVRLHGETVGGVGLDRFERR